MKQFLRTIALVSLLTACSSPSADQAAQIPVPSNPRLELRSVQLTNGTDRTLPLIVEIADEPLELQRGLMGRTELPPLTGMLFIFDQPQPLSFWMKNTLIPLDIMYFDADGHLVSSTTMIPCKADPCVTYPSGGNAKYVLEMSEGFVQEHGITGEWTLVTP